MTVVSHRHKLIFLKTRKTAGTSIELALSRVAGESDVLSPLEPEDEATRANAGRSNQNDLVTFRRYHWRDFGRLIVRRRRASFLNHMPASAVRSYVGEDCWRTYRKFTVERHPYDRAVSMYFWHQRTGGHQDIHSFLRSFPPSKLSNSSIYAIDGKLVVDDVLDFDGVGKEFGALMEQYGVVGAPELSRAKSGVRSDTSTAAEALGHEGIRLVQAACREDFELMGHER